MSKGKIVFIIAIAIVAAVILGIAFYNLGINDENIIGNHLFAYNYVRGVKEHYYKSKQDAINTIVPAEKDVIYETEDGNVFIVFGLEENAISGYEFLERESGYYEFIGEKKIIFVTDLEQKEYSWEKNFKADLCLSLQTTYKNATKLGEDYSVLPAWGISKFPDIGKVTIDGLSVNDVKEFEYDGENYYLWFMNDVSSIESVSEAEIVVD